MAIYIVIVIQNNYIIFKIVFLSDNVTASHNIHTMTKVTTFALLQMVIQQLFTLTLLIILLPIHNLL